MLPFASPLSTFLPVAAPETRTVRRSLHAVAHAHRHTMQRAALLPLRSQQRPHCFSSAPQRLPTSCQCRRHLRAPSAPLRRSLLQARALPPEPPSPGGDPAAAGATPREPSAAAAAEGAAVGGVPSFKDGIDWYCYTVLWLLFLVDLTPLGAALSSGTDAPPRLAAFQAAAFFVPTLCWAGLQRGWDLRRTFLGEAAPSTKWMAIGLSLGPAVWMVTTGLISLKTGVWIGDTPAASDAAAAAGGPLSGVVAASLEGSGAGQVAALFATVAAAPAVMEEMLFRGLLLTALQSRLGRIDAVAVAGALFAAVHLSLEQFFPLSVLGFAAGAAAVLSGSVWPAVALHCGYNATGLAVGLALHAGGGGV